MEIDYKARLDKLTEIGGADALALVPGSNLIYFTGLHYHLSERPIIAFVTEEGLSLIVPKLEVPSLVKRPDLEARIFVWEDSEGFENAFIEAVESLGLRGKTLGIDGMTMRATEWLQFLKVDPTMKVNPIERELIKIRSHKTPDEIALMRRATQISEAALDRLIQEVKPGMTENQIATRLEALMMEGGGEELAFGTLVQTGGNSDNPHGVTTDRALNRGEFLLIDFGCKVGGYPADITRTFVMGEVNDQMRRMYDAVQAANAAAKAAAGPGVPMGDVDKAARDAITEAGFGEYFIHRTGHGLGMDVHEPIPQIAAGVTDLLEPGMMFTVEPGVYLPGVGGVRIEDNVLITENGIDVLTSYPRDLRILG